MAALAKLLKQGAMPGEVREALSEALKHLTASSQKNRNSLVSLQILPLIIAQLTTGRSQHTLPVLVNGGTRKDSMHHAVKEEQTGTSTSWYKFVIKQDLWPMHPSWLTHATPSSTSQYMLAA